MEDILITENPDYINFEAKTARHAIIKFLRLNRLNPNPWNNADNLISAGKDIEQQTVSEIQEIWWLDGIITHGNNSSRHILFQNNVPF